MTHSKQIALRKFVLVGMTAFSPITNLWAQTPQTTAPPGVTVVLPPKTDTALANATAKSVPLRVTSNVSDSASIQAVLIPADLAKRIFGKEVSQNYAVIEVIISNRDTKASLVVHSIFLDYSKWLLSGPRESRKTPVLDNWQKANNPLQVASIESRLVRGEMLDAQQWTARNWTIRGLTALGSIAAAFQFPFTADVAKGISSFNGVLVPGASTLWPDGTVNQINRISDFGFQTNKIIAREGSDILVAFFPINRFLTPSFRSIFLSNPAALFVPGEMIADPKTFGKVQPIIEPLADQMGLGGKEFRANMLQSVIEPCHWDDPRKRDAPATSNLAASMGGPALATPTPVSNMCKLQKLFNGISLNNVHLILEGSMTIEVATVPATVYSVDFDKGNTDATVWTATGAAQSGTITGIYLTGGIPALVDDTGKAIGGAKFTMLPNGMDTQLQFTMTLSSCIPPDSKVFFVVNKSQSTAGSDDDSDTTTASAAVKNSTTPVASTPYLFPLPSYSCPNLATPAAPGVTP